MSWLLTIVLCVALVELMLRLPLAAPLRRLMQSGARAAQVVRSPRISDHWKEKAMGAYARRSFASTALLFGALVLVLGTALGLVQVFDRVHGGFETFLLSWLGLGASLVIASLYAYARRSRHHA